MFTLQALAEQLGPISFFETSAKDASNVEAAFRTLVGEIMECDALNVSPTPTVNASNVIGTCVNRMNDTIRCRQYYQHGDSDGDYDESYLRRQRQRNDPSCFC